MFRPLLRGVGTIYSNGFFYFSQYLGIDIYHRYIQKGSSGVQCEGFSKDFLGWVTRLVETFFELLWGTFCPRYTRNLQDDHQRGWRCCFCRRMGRGWEDYCFSWYACWMIQLVGLKLCLLVLLILLYTWITAERVVAWCCKGLFSLSRDLMGKVGMTNWNDKHQFVFLL